MKTVITELFPQAHAEAVINLDMEFAVEIVLAMSGRSEELRGSITIEAAKAIMPQIANAIAVHDQLSTGCAWCGAWISGPGSTSGAFDSHGICPKCLDLVKRGEATPITPNEKE